MINYNKEPPVKILNLFFKYAMLNHKKEVEGRPSLDNIITKIHQFMSKLKIIIFVVVVVAIALIWGRSNFRATPPQTTETPSGNEEQAVTTGNEEQTATTESEVAPPAATGDVDSAVVVFLQDSSSESATFQDETSDTDLVGEDDQAISDFGQSYDENTF